MNRPPILIAGIGNIFLGDDGFGVAVARRLMERTQPAHVRVVDFGIRGIDLAYALLECYEFVVLVDIVQRESKPGTIHVIEVDDEVVPSSGRSPETHGMVPTRAIELARMMGAKIPRLVLVGCEPQGFGNPDEGEIALSPPVSIAIEQAIAAVEALIDPISSESPDRRNAILPYVDQPPSVPCSTQTHS